MNDEDDDKPLPRPWGDYAMILVAGGFSVAALSLIGYMLLGGHPYAVLFGSPAAGAASRPMPPQVPITLAPGEVAISTDSVNAAAVGETPFPQIKGWPSLRIALRRSACFGTCPVYSVEIAGDGTVTYRGEACVAQKGERTGHVSPDTVKALFGAFRDARFFALRGRYSAAITDMPTYTTSISFDGKSKSVEDYAGERAGMPQSVTGLETAIDEAAGTSRWTAGGKPGC